jgi:hypothetical protein
VQNIDVSSAALQSVAASVMHTDSPVRILASTLEPFGIPLFNMTTGGLWRLQATAMDNRGPHEVRAVLKVIHTPLRWSGIETIPEDMRGYVVAHIPWRTEAEVYESDLGDYLPPGLRLPDIYRIEYLDEDSAGIWMEDVQQEAVTWDEERYTRMANLLGRLAGVQGAPMGTPRDIADFVVGPGDHVFIPLLRSGMLGCHPAFDGTIDGNLERDMLGFVDRIPLLLAELSVLPTTRAHGDACPQNLLQTGEGAVALDWGSFGTVTAGFDLGQLLAGRVNDGLLDGSLLPRLAPACLEAYLQGLRDEGAHFSPGPVRRGLAISMALQSGLPALFPRELDGPLTDEVRGLVHARAGMARFLVDELTATGS